MSEPVSVQVSQDIVLPILQAKIATAIAEVLGKTPALMEEIAARALARKVNREGKEDYYGKTPYIEWLCDSAIEQAAQAAVQQWVKDKQDSIRAVIVKAMNRQAASIAEKFVADLANRAEHGYKFDIAITTK